MFCAPCPYKSVSERLPYLRVARIAFDQVRQIRQDFLHQSAALDQMIVGMQGARQITAGQTIPRRQKNTGRAVG